MSILDRVPNAHAFYLLHRNMSSHSVTETCGVQAELAERDFTAEKGEVIVISTGAAVDAKAEASSERERKAAEERNRHRCRRCLLL